MQNIHLASGRSLPAVGFGLWKIARPETASVVEEAIDAGYRHFDSASDYGNEAEVGEGLQAAISTGKVKREDLWVTSKLWNNYHRAEHVEPALRRTLSDLRLDYLDLYLMHFPIALKYVPFETRYPAGWFDAPDEASPSMVADAVPLIETWEAMVECQAKGLIREVGVCNFGVSLLRDLMNCSTTPPAVLQIESHPYLTQEKLIRFCHESKIAVTAFSPLGAQSYFSLDMASSDEAVIDRDEVVAIAEAHGKTAAQVVLRWGVQRGTSVVVKSSHKKRTIENLGIFDFELSVDEMQAISALNCNRRFNDPGEFCESAFNTFFPIYE